MGALLRHHRPDLEVFLDLSFKEDDDGEDVDYLVHKFHHQIREKE